MVLINLGGIKHELTLTSNDVALVVYQVASLIDPAAVEILQVTTSLVRAAEYDVLAFVVDVEAPK